MGADVPHTAPLHTKVNSFDRDTKFDSSFELACLNCPLLANVVGGNYQKVISCFLYLLIVNYIKLFNLKWNKMVKHVRILKIVKHAKLFCYEVCNEYFKDLTLFNCCVL